MTQSPLARQQAGLLGLRGCGKLPSSDFDNIIKQAEFMTSKTFSNDDKRRSRIFRLAQIIYDHWEEQSVMDIRYFDHPFIHDEYVVNGKSHAGGRYREHAVPKAYLRDECLRLLDLGASL